MGRKFEIRKKIKRIKFDVSSIPINYPQIVYCEDDNFVRVWFSKDIMREIPVDDELKNFLQVG